MGHYNMEDHYAEARGAARKRAEQAIEKILDCLEGARVLVANNASCIDFSARIEGDIKFTMAALRGQVAGQ